mgnify:CR=1 FL=1
MLRKVMRAKIHRAKVTRCDPDYVGSITIDADLLAAVDLRPNEAVLVADIDNGNRFETYVFRGEPGSGVIGINGAAAKLVEVGHRVIILSFGYLDEAQLDQHTTRVVVTDEKNRITERLSHRSVI